MDFVVVEPGWEDDVYVYDIETKEETLPARRGKMCNYARCPSSCRNLHIASKSISPSMMVVCPSLDSPLDA